MATRLFNFGEANPLVAPFNAGEAVAAQKAWAAKLGLSSHVVENSLRMKFTVIPPGEFQRGNESSVEELRKVFPYSAKEALQLASPAHRVKLTEPFLLGLHEVTLGQFKEFVVATNYETDAEKDGKVEMAGLDKNGSRNLSSFEVPRN